MIKGLIQRTAKLLAVKVGVLKKKSDASAISPKVCASTFGPVSIPIRFESFSKFDCQQLCSPIIYRRCSSNPLLKEYTISVGGWQLFQVKFCFLKVNLLSFYLLPSCMEENAMTI